MKIYQRLLECILNLKRFQVFPLSELKEPPKKILVFSITALGDTLFSTPAIKSLKLSFPNTKIIGIVHHKWYPLFKNFPYVDKLYIFKKGVFNILSLGKQLKKENAEGGLIFHGNYPEDILLCVLSEVKFILKSSIDEKYKRFLSFTDFNVNTHAIETRLALVKALGGNKLCNEMEIGPLNSNYYKKKYLEIFKKFKGKKKCIGFQLGASYQAKRWPVEHFVKLAMLLNKIIDCVFVLIGSKKETSLANTFERLYSLNNVLNFTGKTNIEELPYLLKNLDLLVTPDTGILHLAISLKIPTVSIFALTDPKYYGPYQDLELHRVVFNPEGLKYKNIKKRKRPLEPMKNISPELVFKEVKELLL